MTRGGGTPRAGTIAGGLLVLGAAGGLKSYYSQAAAGGLNWILGPTAGAVSLLTGLPFVGEAGAGWVNYEARVIIAPECAGVNFLIMSFCLAAFQGLLRLKTPIRQAAWLIVAGLGAYGWTIITNAIRIHLSIHLFQGAPQATGLSAEGVHRIAGVTVYYLFLCFSYHLVSFMLTRVEPAAAGRFPTGPGGLRWPHFIPLFWYLIFTLGIPVLNNAHRLHPGRLGPHALAVAATAALCTLLWAAAMWGCRRLAGRIARRRRPDGAVEGRRARRADEKTPDTHRRG